MEILAESARIREELINMKPTRIAVAYVGEGWKKYTPSDRLREIIISPTVGSSPSAIRELMAALGERNVHFLDKLHAKIYISDSAAIVGSCNLSDNGFSDGHLYEAAALISDSALISRLNEVFGRYKKQAQKLYPDESSKLDRLKRLQQEHNERIVSGFIKVSPKKIPIENYQGLEKIYIAWYNYGEASITDTAKAAIKKSDPTAKIGDPEKYFDDYNGFVDGDKIEKGSWVLNWECDHKYEPKKNGPMNWMYVHYVIPHGLKNTGFYTQLVGQAKKKECPPVPFELDKTTKQSIRELLVSKEFSALCSFKDPRKWRADQNEKCMDQFIDRLKQTVAARRRPA